METYTMTFNDEKTNTAGITGPDQLSHLYKRVNLHDRHQHDQRLTRTGAAEAEVENEVQVGELQ